MTEEQVDRLLTLLQAEYPHSFSGMDDRMLALKRNLWIKEFEQDDNRIVLTAARLYMKSGGAFAPTIGQLREKIAMLTTSGGELPEQSAWALVSKACANGLYGYKEEYDKLPPEVQRAVGAPEQLREWAKMDSETVQSVVASNFMRNYRTQQAREREIALIPPEVRNLLEKAGGMLRLTGGEEDASAV